jgi:hypothetical protein
MVRGKEIAVYFKHLQHTETTNYQSNLGNEKYVMVRGKEIAVYFKHLHLQKQPITSQI